MKKIGLICLAVVLVAGGLGVGYATWKDDVQIDGTVQMNDFVFGILQDSVSTSDNEEDGPFPYKEIGNCTAVLSDFETGVHHEPVATVGKLLTINVTGAYPCYKQWINFVLKNAGTVPAHITLVDIYDPNDELTYDAGLDALVDAAGKPVINFKFVKETVEVNCRPDPGEPDVTACQQIDPCNEVPVCLELHFKEDALECHTYTFKIHIEAIQWNKVVY